MIASNDTQADLIDIYYTNQDGGWGFHILRAFGQLSSTLADMEEAVSSYTSRVAEKLRRARLAATVLTVCLTTNEFKEGPQYSNAVTLKFSVATDSTSDLIRSALQGIRTIYRDGCHYKKAGVMLTSLVPASEIQADLFDYQDRGKSKRLMSALDAVNNRWGAGTLHYASNGISKAWTTQFRRTVRLPIRRIGLRCRS